MLSDLTLCLGALKTDTCLPWILGCQTDFVRVWNGGQLDPQRTFPSTHIHSLLWNWWRLTGKHAQTYACIIGDQLYNNHLARQPLHSKTSSLRSFYWSFKMSEWRTESDHFSLNVMHYDASEYYGLCEYIPFALIFSLLIDAYVLCMYPHNIISCRLIW